ncbi:ribonuclease 3-like protein 2 [Gossypium australe]|uniref:Ribonuclease 3-like protein 2 n=1 Tax=Gossypium australe TaxID=47621 RepID=A0A5B6U8Q2_9ROSI|nr:ribonuclease 3-like protein 2 [Gossypium australe]
MPMFVPCFPYVKICDMMQSFEGQIRIASSDSVLDTYVHALLVLKCLVLSFSIHMFVPLCDMMQSFEGQIQVASSDSVLDTYVHALRILKCLVLSFSMHMFVPCFSHVKILNIKGRIGVRSLDTVLDAYVCSLLEKDEGPPHEKKFVSAVKIPTEDGIFYITGDKKSRVKEADNSAASCMIQSLKELRYL